MFQPNDELHPWLWHLQHASWETILHGEAAVKVNFAVVPSLLVEAITQVLLCSMNAKRDIVLDPHLYAAAVNLSPDNICWHTKEPSCVVFTYLFSQAINSNCITASIRRRTSVVIRIRSSINQTELIKSSIDLLSQVHMYLLLLDQLLYLVTRLVVRCECGCKKAIDRSFYRFFKSYFSDAMQCEFFRIFASHSHFRIASIFPTFSHFSHRMKTKENVNFSQFFIFFKEIFAALGNFLFFWTEQKWIEESYAILEFWEVSEI
jgi:hypothetical protein